MLNKSLTVVLPVYNGETRLRKSVHEILELASELTTKFGVLIIDDGSNDATYEVAEDLAAHYPQVSVRRNRHRRGLGPTIDDVQRGVRSNAVILHDGVTPIDAREIRSLWRRWIAQAPATPQQGRQPASAREELRDLAKLPAIHAALEKAHGRLTGFQMMMPATTPADEDVQSVVATTRRNDAVRAVEREGIGTIPRMPRPKFLTALANFAMGE